MRVGTTQFLTVCEQDAQGLQLAESAAAPPQDRVLLPIDKSNRERIAALQTGDSIEVFILTDRDGQPLASLEHPRVERDQCASLRIADSGQHGAFLDWGLAQDLFLPWAEQRRPREVGQYETVLVYLDNSNRLAATSRIDHHLTDKPEGLRPWDKVELLIFQRTDLGFKAVINHRAIGLLYKDEIYQRLRVGERLSGYIRRIREDGRIDLSLQPRANDLNDQLSQAILDRLRSEGGSLALTDHSSPDDIKAAFSVSKKAYKRALSSLYKTRQIVIEDNQIRLPD